ncbi:signal peptidase I [Borrelia miyamotoi]|uniref:Signal peptidase I n=1 Tax=Borrelia miyamotoi TaxID=47466 RepID=A0AAX3JNG5_9SPIR|nr:signal peptidase I [Borrelia miyamotoi]QFP42259.1 signal peptidase I [Borrelia miyamotoi]QFP48373.1 signal peptidase I [Borrelia miyamotoi]QGT56133.1 signal peptidase I [Borrelia miyamotoi]QGT56913.1 signal peptidase I [Borrelia miyamotoi]WAZ72178.1 signal peptidase I [Borrelia miyamotoi]
MAAYLTFEQRLLKKKRRQSFFNFILLFLVLNYFFTKFVLQIFTCQGSEMLPLITKNNDLIFVSRHIRSFVVFLKMNDIVLYEDLSLRRNLVLDFFRDLFFLNKIFNTKSYKISRIVAIQGDLVYVKGFDVLVYRRDNNCYYLNGNLMSAYKLNDFFSFNEVIKCFDLKKNEFFLLNDNLKILNDSRVFGPIKKSHILSLLMLKIMDNKIVK